MLLQFVVVLFVSCSSALRHERNALRVYKGEGTTHHEFPYVVLLQQRNMPFARRGTGSLIAERWVLTAAHCFYFNEDPLNELVIRYGDFLTHPTSPSYSKLMGAFVPSSFLVHDKRTLTTRDDIGLLLIERIPTANNPTGKILSLDYRSLFGLHVKFAGFGHISRPSYAEAPETVPLQMGEGVLLPCDNFRNLGPVICVEPKCLNRNQGARLGDAGGPLVYDGRIIGVTKGPSSLTLDATGASFTPVSVYLQWIERVISSNANIPPNRT